jgi:YVTN family beta-propeller protein
VLVIALLTVVSSPGVFSAILSGAHRPDESASLTASPSLLHSPSSNPTALAPGEYGLTNVSSTFDLFNRTMLAGDAPTYVGSDPDAVIGDPMHHHIFIGDLGSGPGPALSVLNSSTGVVEDTIPLGSGAPTAFAIDPAAPKLYVADYSRDLIRVFNTSSLAPIAQIPTGHEPDGIAVDVARHRIYVTNDLSAFVSVIDTVNYTAVGNFAPVDAAYGLAYDPLSGILYVPSAPHNNVTMFNTSNGQVLGSFAAGGAPQNPIYVPSTDQVLIPNSATGDNLTVVNGSSGKVVGEFPAGLNPYAVVQDPPTGRLFIASEEGRALTVDSANGTLLQQISFNPLDIIPFSVGEDPSARSVVVVGEAVNRVTRINADTFQVYPTIPLGTFPGPMAFDPATSTLGVLNSDNGTVILLSTPGLAAERFVPVGQNLTSIVPGPPGMLLITSRTSGSVIEVNDTTGAIVRTIPVGSDPASQAYVPGLGRLFVTLPNGSEVVRVDVAAGTVDGLTVAGTAPEGIAYLPGPSLIAVSNAGSGNVSVLSAATGALVRTIGVGGSPGGMVLDPADGRLYVLDRSSPVLTPLSAETGAVGSSVPLGRIGSTATIDTNSGDILVTNPNPGAVIDVDWRNGSILRTVDTQLGTGGVAYDALDGLAFASNEFSGSLSLLAEPLGGAHPRFTVGVSYSPAGCGPVVVGGANASDGSVVVVGPGALSLQAPRCPGRTFPGWNATSLLPLDDNTTYSANATVTGPGSVVATYLVAAIVKLHLILSPAGCGPATVNGSSVSDGSTLRLAVGLYEAVAPACPGQRFVGWSGGAGLVVSPTSNASRATVQLYAEGTLQATWAPPSTGIVITNSLAIALFLVVVAGTVIAVGLTLFYRRRRIERTKSEPPREPTFPDRVKDLPQTGIEPEPTRNGRSP